MDSWLRQLTIGLTIILIHADTALDELKDITIKTLDGRERIYLCHLESNISKYLVCSATSHSSPVFTVTQNGILVNATEHETTIDPGNHTARVSYSFKVNMPGANSYRYQCNVSGDGIQNASSATLEIQVLQPPQMEPVMQTKVTNPNGRISANPRLVMEGSDVTVRCFVEGGYPGTRPPDIKIVCGARQVVGDHLDIVNIKHLPGTFTCSCTASHVSNCYNKTSFVGFKLRHSPHRTKREKEEYTQQREELDDTKYTTDLNNVTSGHHVTDPPYSYIDIILLVAGGTAVLVVVLAVGVQMSKQYPTGLRDLSNPAINNITEVNTPNDTSLSMTSIHMKSGGVYPTPGTSNSDDFSLSTISPMNDSGSSKPASLHSFKA